MKISKKLFAVLLAVVLAFSVAAVGASAAGTPTGDEWMTVTVSTDKGTESYEKGDTIVVTVSIACNYNVPTFRFPILFDKNVIEQKANIAMAAKGPCVGNGSLRNNANPDDETHPVFPEAYDSTEWGCILFQWTADVKNGAVACINAPEGTAVFSFELKVKSNAVGTGTILIPEESDLLYYMAFEDPSIATSDYYLTPDTCTMTFVPANVTVALPDVKLIPNEAFDSTAIIDEDNLYVYGLGLGIATNAEIKDYVKATGGAIIRSETTEADAYGTGAKINLTLSGATVKTYTVILFGDLNGDADVTAVDTSLLKQAVAGTVDLTDIQVFAGDIGNFDGDYDSVDVLMLKSVVAGSIDLNQQGPAAL